MVLCITTVSIHAGEKKSITVPGLMKPSMMVIEGDRMFVVESPQILVYSLKNMKLIARFGKAGEGPEEFKINPYAAGLTVFPFKNQLAVNSDTKVSYWTRDGKFIKELKAPPFGGFVPYEDGYIGYVAAPNAEGKLFLGVYVYSKTFEKGKQLYLSDMQVGPGAVFNIPTVAFAAYAYKGNIYIPKDTTEMAIDVYDYKGKLQKQLKVDYKQLPVGEAFKKNAMHWFKNESPYKKFAGTLLKMTFKEKFPVIKTFNIDNDKLYVITNKITDGKHECYILDLNGKVLDRVWLALPPEPPMLALEVYQVVGGKFYSLWENEDTEVWELHIQTIEK
jgi:hypothetical protein